MWRRLSAFFPNYQPFRGRSDDYFISGGGRLNGRRVAVRVAMEAGLHFFHVFHTGSSVHPAYLMGPRDLSSGIKGPGRGWQLTTSRLVELYIHSSTSLWHSDRRFYRFFNLSFAREVPHPKHEPETDYRNVLWSIFVIKENSGAAFEK